MILYSVYIDDDLIFQTYNKQKAYNFRDVYNKNIETYFPCFVIQEEVSPDVLEPQANQIIRNYEEHYHIEIGTGEIA